MGNVNSSPADERFSETHLTSEFGESSGPLYTQYTCPQCRRALNFTRNDFENRGRHKTTNLPSECAADISLAALDLGLDQKAYLDWACPGCQLPARVYFSGWAGGRHGDGGIDLITVVEIR
jgi:hypothetical protein